MFKTTDARGALIGGRYRLVDLAGRGSMAEVWRAELIGAEGFHRTVALKRMSPHLANMKDFRRLFVREARLNSLLDHPNVVQVLDFGVDDVGLYMVSEWVEGLTMKDIQSLCVAFGVRTSPVLVAAIGIEVLRALEAAHNNVERFEDGTRRPLPIIHRDLSPSNVLLSVRGVVKLADFGMARALEDAALTPTVAVMSKIRYMAPEVAAGQTADARADLYSCGAMLWEAMTSVDLWAGHSPAQIALALSRGTRPPPLREVRPDVPAGLAAVIDRALAPRFAEGYRVAATFARDLSDVLRMIPERTDTTRLANEVENALGLRRQLRAQQRHSAEAQVHRLPNSRPSRELPEPEPGERLDAAGYPAEQTGQVERESLRVASPQVAEGGHRPRRQVTRMAPTPAAWVDRPMPPTDVPEVLFDSDRPERDEATKKIPVPPPKPMPDMKHLEAMLAGRVVQPAGTREAAPDVQLELDGTEIDLGSLPPEERD